MKHRFDISNILQGLISYKGIPFPGIFLTKPKLGGYTGDNFDVPNTAPDQKHSYVHGAPLYGIDKRWRWYFMPIKINNVSIPNAVIKISCSKNIVETPLQGRKGSVIELISQDNDKVSIAGVILSDDGTYPIDQIAQLKELFALNESVKLISAITQLVFDPDDKVVIRKYDFPPTPGLEDGQAFTLECVTDRPFELIIE